MINLEKNEQSVTPAERSHWRRIFSKDDVEKQKSIKARAKDLVHRTLKFTRQTVYGVLNFVKKSTPDLNIILPTTVGLLGIFARGLSSTKCLIAGSILLMKQFTNKSTAYLTYFCNLFVNGSMGFYSLILNFSGKIMFYLHEQFYAKIAILFENPFLVFLSLLLNVAFVTIATVGIMIEKYF